MFFIAAGVYFLGNTMFVIFGKTDIQPWNEPQKSRKALEAEQEQNNAKQASDFGKHTAIVLLCVSEWESNWRLIDSNAGVHFSVN